MEKGGAVTSGSSSQYALKTRAAGQTLSVPPLCFFGGCRSLAPVWFGLDGVICSMPASDILTAVIPVVLIKKTYRQLRESESGVAFSIEA